MMTLLLLLMLQQPMRNIGEVVVFPPEQKIGGACWDESDGATSYKVYRAAFGEPWQQFAVMIPPAGCNQDASGQVRCCITWDWLEFPRGHQFIAVTALNSAGESSTEHGSFPGEGYDPWQP